MEIIVPETHDLRRVVRVVEAIRDGEAPHDSCGLSSRQASYALQAALALGLLSRQGQQYDLTDSGRLILSSEGAERIAQLRRAIEGMPLVTEVVPRLLDPNLTVDQLADVLERDTGLSRATAQKRASALAGWRAQVASAGNQPPIAASSVLLVHLSDVHFTAVQSENPVADRTSEIAAALAGRFDLRKPDACVILITGDIAQSGNSNEYKIAGQFIAALSTVLRTRLQCEVFVVTVPGNHDCNLHAESSVRTTILDNVSPDGIDSDIVNESLKVQSDYRTFASKHESSLTPVFTAPAVAIGRLRMGAREIRIDRYNTSWCSRRHEQQGALMMPVPSLPELPDCDAVVAMFHHPYSWLTSNNARDFHSHIENSADLVLTGHEHVASRYRKILETGEHTEYLEGAVLQDREDPANSGFNAVLINFDSLTQESMVFAWSKSMYELRDRFPERPFLRTKLKSRSLFQLTQEHSEFLNEPGDVHKHPKKAKLSLEDIYIYPEMKPAFISGGRNGSSPLIKDPREYLLKERKVFILGEESIGKTSLSKRLFVDIHREGLVPVLINGQEISDPSVDALEELRQKAFCRAYGSARLEQFLQLEPDKRALIVDDAHLSRLSVENLDKALSRLCETFGYCAVIADDDLAVTLLDAPRDDGVDSILSFETAAIEPFGCAKRYQLVETWCFIGRKASDDQAALSRRAQQLDELIGHATGSNLLPAFPALILLCLQQMDAARQGSLGDGSFGHLYSALVTENLWREGTSSIDIDAKRRFLSIFAHHLYRTELGEVSRSQWEDLYEKYRDDYDVAYPTQAFLDEVLQSELVVQSNGEVSFRYKYAYCFFVASYLIERSGSERLQIELQSLFGQLHRDDFGNVLLFLAHLDRDGTVGEALLNFSRAMGKIVDGFDLHAHLLPLGVSEHISKLTLDADSPEKRRRLEREARDRVDRESPAPVENGGGIHSVELQQYIGAVRTVRILGEVLRGAPGSMLAEKKREVLEECYALGARTMQSLIQRLVENHAEIAADLARLLIQHRPELANDLSEVKSRVRSFLISLCEGVVYGMTLHMSRAVGSESLVRTYEHVRDENAENVAYQLFDLAIRLDHLSAFPEQRVAALEKAFRDKPSPNNVLRRVIFRHLYLFPVRYDLRRSLCSRFDIKENTLLLRKQGAR